MTFEIIQKIICDLLDLREDDVTEESSLYDDLDMSSIDIVDLVMSLEDEFEIEVPDEACEKFEFVEDIVSYIDDNK